jgi:hypothetical protein
MPVRYSSYTFGVELASRFLENVWAQPYSVGVIDPFKRTCENNLHYFMVCTDSFLK